MTTEAAPREVGSNDWLGVGVGSTVWVFDINRRVYRERKPGEKYAVGAPIWREHWVPRKIVGETVRSWVLVQGGRVPKKGADPHLFSFSEADIARRAWVHDNRHLIERAVGRVCDYDTLRSVAALIGYETPNVALSGAPRDAAEANLP